jgi:pentatricopeptide repeat protein
MKHPASAPVAGLQQAGGAAGWSFRTGPPPFPGSYAPPAAYYGNSGGLDALGFGGAQLSGSGGHPGVSPSPDGTAVVQQDNSEQMRVAGAGFGWSPPCAPSVCGGCGFEGGVCGYRGLPGTGPPGGFGFFEPPPQARFDSPEHSTAQQQALQELAHLLGCWGAPERIVCNQELKRLQAQQQWRESRHIMALMGRAGILADVGRYNALILWFKKNKQWADALAVLTEMKQAGVRPSIVSFNSVLDAAGKARQLQIAFDLLQQVKLEGLTPDTVTYTSLIDACGKAQHVERAFQILRQMQESVLPLPHPGRL